jgi:hypothetical protein
VRAGRTDASLRSSGPLAFAARGTWLAAPVAGLHLAFERRGAPAAQGVRDEAITIGRCTGGGHARPYAGGAGSGQGEDGSRETVERINQLDKDVYAFIFGQKGLMAGLGVQGNKITKITPK